MLTITNQMILEQIQGCVAWKDINLRYLGANKKLLNLMKLKHPLELIGLDDNQLALNPPKINEIYEQQDRQVLNGRCLEVIHRLDNPSDKKAYFLQKSPLRDGQNNIIGIILLCVPWSQADILDSLRKIDQKFQSEADIPNYYSVNMHHNPAQLSNRELECLFLQLRGQTAKQIAEILQLSKRTVEYYIDNMKSKLGSSNKSELLIAAITHGYQFNIPKSLLNLNLPEFLNR